MGVAELAKAYRRNGYVSGVPIVSEEEAAMHRAAMEAAERTWGPLHYRSKMHTVMRSPLELATHPRVLDLVEAMIGPDILLYDATYIVKEPGSTSHVSWHQDLKFWGLSEEANEGQVTLWLALSPATDVSGCMRMIPGSHRQADLEHATGADDSNVLLQAQTVHGVDEAQAVMCPLHPGEASFHHGWTLHASMPNRSHDRRIGLNAQFVVPSVRQIKHDLDSAMLVRGEDRFGHFRPNVPARADFEPEAVRRWEDLNRLTAETQGMA